MLFYKMGQIKIGRRLKRMLFCKMGQIKTCRRLKRMLFYKMGQIKTLWKVEKNAILQNGTNVKNSLEIIVKQVRLEGGLRGGGISVMECLRQIVTDRWASISKRSFTKCF